MRKNNENPGKIMIREAIGKIVTGTDLAEQEMVEVMQEIMGGEATDAQISSFITALRMKGETVDEIVGAVKVMREKATFVDTGVKTDQGEILMDIVGTGGDGANTVNISSATSLVVASLGVTVAKHGNRSVSSKCGSADFFETLGININLPIEEIPAA